MRVNSAIPSHIVRRFAHWCLALNVLVIVVLFLGCGLGNTYMAYWARTGTAEELTRSDRPPEGATQEQQEAYQQRYQQVREVMSRRFEPGVTIANVAGVAAAALSLMSCFLLYMLARRATKAQEPQQD